jgi:hypothetical protein
VGSPDYIHFVEAENRGTAADYRRHLPDGTADHNPANSFDLCTVE